VLSNERVFFWGGGIVLEIHLIPRFYDSVTLFGPGKEGEGGGEGGVA